MLVTFRVSVLMLVPNSITPVPFITADKLGWKGRWLRLTGGGGASTMETDVHPNGFVSQRLQLSVSKHNALLCQSIIDELTSQGDI